MKRTIAASVGAAVLILTGSPAMAASPTAATADPLTCLIKQLGTSLGLPNLLGTGAAACGTTTPPPAPEGPSTPGEGSGVAPN